jgi:L-threonylcarbamoyladenylate synthase
VNPCFLDQTQHSAFIILQIPVKSQNCHNSPFVPAPAGDTQRPRPTSYSIIAGQKDYAEALRAARECLNRGGVIAAPTETVYGLMTRWDNSHGRKRIFQLKHRPPERQLQMLAPDLQCAADAGVVITSAAQRLANAFWPGPLTLVLPTRDGHTVGLRIPGHVWLLELLLILPWPLAATSANRSGEPPALNAADAWTCLAGTPDLVIDGGSIPEGKASTVASLTDNKLQVLRPGPISAEQLQQAIRQEQP